ncbi:hypothetical protein C8Q76DRAFT_88236 [Earliella scabrosa]|nr:hypothetical protein C8Q76DRAFT_88236 [Earliella scabrosa]
MNSPIQAAEAPGKQRSSDASSSRPTEPSAGTDQNRLAERTGHRPSEPSQAVIQSSASRPPGTRSQHDAEVQASYLENKHSRRTFPRANHIRRRSSMMVAVNPQSSRTQARANCTTTVLPRHASTQDVRRAGTSEATVVALPRSESTPAHGAHDLERSERRT